MSVRGSFEDWFVDHDSEFYEVWTERDNGRLIDEWASKSAKVQAFIKETFLNEARGSEYEAFLRYAEECWRDRPEPEED